MKSGPSRRGFTLLEVLFAILIFSVAVVALVQAINGMGEAAAAAQRNREVVARLDSLLLELTRKPPQNLEQAGRTENVLREGGVEYRTLIEPVDLQNKDFASLNGVYAAKAIARWNDGGRSRELSADTLLYLPLYAPFQ